MILLNTTFMHTTIQNEIQAENSKNKILNKIRAMSF